MTTNHHPDTPDSSATNDEATPDLTTYALSLAEAVRTACAGEYSGINEPTEGELSMVGNINSLDLVPIILSVPKPECERELVIKGDLFLVRFLPDGDAEVILKQAGYRSAPTTAPQAATPSQGEQGEPYPYDALFRAIGDAAKTESNGIAISVRQFVKTLASKGYCITPQAATTEQAGATYPCTACNGATGLPCAQCRGTGKMGAGAVKQHLSPKQVLDLVATLHPGTTPAATTASASGTAICHMDAGKCGAGGYCAECPHRAPAPSREAAQLAQTQAGRNFDVEQAARAIESTGDSELAARLRHAYRAALAGRDAAPLDERALFEATVRAECGMTGDSLAKSDDGRYEWGRTADMFWAWNRRAALARPAAPVVDGELPPLPESLEIDWPQLNSQALGCGVEDRGIHDRYEAAQYGWQDGVDKAAERVPEQIYDADQMREYGAACVAAARSAPVGQDATQAELLAQCRRARNLIETGNPEAALTCLQDAIDAAAPSHPEPAGGDGWKKLANNEVIEWNRKLDVVLDNGVTEYQRDYQQIDWTQVCDWRYSPAGGKEQA